MEVKNLEVKLVNNHSTPIITWTLYNAYPTKWEVSGFNAMENKMVVESITLNYSNYTMTFH